MCGIHYTRLCEGQQESVFIHSEEGADFRFVMVTPPNQQHPMGTFQFETLLHPRVLQVPDASVIAWCGGEMMSGLATENRRPATFILKDF